MNFTGNLFPEGGIMTTCKMPPAWTQKVDPDCQALHKENYPQWRICKDEELAGQSPSCKLYLYAYSKLFHMNIQKINDKVLWFS